MTNPDTDTNRQSVSVYDFDQLGGEDRTTCLMDASYHRHKRTFDTLVAARASMKISCRSESGEVIEELLECISKLDEVVKMVRGLLRLRTRVLLGGRLG